MGTLGGAALGAFALLLAGCTATVKDIESEQGSHVAEVVAGPPAAAFRRLTEAARACYSNVAFKIDADYFPDVQQGRLTLGTSRASIAMLTIKLSPAGDGSTAVSLAAYDPLNRGRAREQWARSIGPWARGEPGYCPIDELKPRPKADPSRQ
jgi:hypothetical protein